VDRDGVQFYNKVFTNYEKEIFYNVLFSRRDVRKRFTDKDIDDKTIYSILKAAHHAPSVGFSQPWNFILIKDNETRQRVKDSFLREKTRSVDLMSDDKERQYKYHNLKLEGIMESNLNICVTYDHKRFGPFVIGRMTVEEAGVYSVCCAIQNLWLAARVENIGVGWVSILDNTDLANILNLPKDIKPVAYLCLGYVDKFSDIPDLEKERWLKRTSLKDIVFFEKWEGKNNHNWNGFRKLDNHID
jgi:5,6-dimethylbenzimidazole synthase